MGRRREKEEWEDGNRSPGSTHGNLELIGRLDSTAQAPTESGMATKLKMDYHDTTRYSRPHAFLASRRREREERANVVFRFFTARNVHIHLIADIAKCQRETDPVVTVT